MSDTRIRERHYGNIFTRLSGVEAFRTSVIPLLLLAGASLLWLVSLPAIDPSQMNDLGLVSVLPPTFIIALLILTISFMLILHQKVFPEYLPFLHLLLLIFMLHGTPDFVYGTLRYSWAWKHLGIVDYIQNHGSVNPSIFNLNAYHNWPGFFALAAFFNQVAGLPGSLSYAGLAPVFFNLLNLGVLLLIFKSFTIDRRLVWLSVWLYFLFSWIGQDYFSPQAFAYFLYLVAFAILLMFFRIRKFSSKIDSQKYIRIPFINRMYNSLVDRSIQGNVQGVSTDNRQRLILMSVLVLVFIAIASSHQLTPVMLLSGLVIFFLFQVTNQRYLPLLVGVITTAWVIFMAVGFLNGNIEWIVKSIGSLLDNVNDTLINLNTASPGQQIVARIDRILSLTVWGMGLLGFWRRVRAGHWDIPAILLAFAPLPILVMNAYGGEMLFRVYLFSLPFVTFFAAALFFPTPKTGTSFWAPVFAIVVSFMLIPGFLFSYYGKDRMYYFSPDEVTAAQYVYDNAPPGSLIVDSTWNWPRQSRHYEVYNYLSLVRLPNDKKDAIQADPSEALYDLMGVSAPKAVNLYGSESGSQSEALPIVEGQSGFDLYPTAYFVLTRSQIADAEMTGSLPANWFATISDSLAHSSHFRVVYQTKDATVFELIYPK